MRLGFHPPGIHGLHWAGPPTRVRVPRGQRPHLPFPARVPGSPAQRPTPEPPAGAAEQTLHPQPRGSLYSLHVPPEPRFLTWEMGGGFAGMSGPRDTCFVNRELSISQRGRGDYFRALSSGPCAHVFVNARTGRSKGRPAKYLTDGCGPRERLFSKPEGGFTGVTRPTAHRLGGGVSSRLRMNLLR